MEGRSGVSRLPCVLVLGVFDDAHNLEVPVVSVVTDSEMLSNGILLGEKFAGKSLIYNSYTFRARRVLFRDNPAP